MGGQPGMAGGGGQPAPQMAGGPQSFGGPRPQMRQPGIRPQLRPVTIEDIVQTDVVTADPDTPIATVVAEMAEQDVGSVVVVADEEPTGILTDRKICLALEEDPQVSERTASDLISDDLITATTQDSLFDAIQQMGEGTVRRLPIVDDDGALEGIVSLDDILVLLGAEMQNAVEIIQEQSPRI